MTLSTMTMAGLHDGPGRCARYVELPAKSGVGGGIVAVMPGKGAIAVFAPPLDEAGNSVKAQHSGAGSDSEGHEQQVQGNKRSRPGPIRGALLSAVESHGDKAREQ